MDASLVNLIALGAAKRVTLFEQMMSLFAKGGLKLHLASMELNAGFYPICNVGDIVEGPKFSSQNFDIYLEQELTKRKSNGLAFMDAAIPSLSSLAGRDFGGGKIIASTIEGANIALSKTKTADFCAKHNILHPKIFSQEFLPLNGERLIAKPIEGFGSKGITYFNADEFEEKFELLKDTHIIQECIDGLETTHDLYIDHALNIISSSRDRLSVTGGEVDHCIVRHSTDQEKYIFSQIAQTNLFQGPITVQTMKRSDECFVIEINARLGGGVTGSIEAGFPVLQAWAKDSFGIELPRKTFTPLEMKRCYRDFYRVL